MKLFHVVMWRMSATLVLVLTCWAVMFYWAVTKEVNDELDHLLGTYAESLMRRLLSGEEIPASGSWSNNQYYLYEVSGVYAHAYPHISYRDETVYVAEKAEKEPARVLMTIFRRDDGSYMELVVYTTTIEKNDLQRAVLGWIVFLYVLLFLMILAVNAWVFHHNMKPLYHLLKWLENYHFGDTGVTLDENIPVVEFRKLNQAINSASARSAGLFEQQKLFIGNASHEMQTPLAACLNRLEMMMEDESLNEKQLSEVLKTHRTLENLTRLNKSLLLLCKIDNHQFDDIKPVCLNELLASYIDDYKEAYSYRGIRVNVETDGCFRVEMSESLASVLVTNLLKNSFVHGAGHGEIDIRFTSRSFSVANTGDVPLDGDKVFGRFYKGNAPKEGSTGLGLALVDSICKAYGLKVSYAFRDGKHVFSVFV